jgi:hypothetical protein
VRCSLVNYEGEFVGVKDRDERQRAAPLMPADLAPHGKMRRIPTAAVPSVRGELLLPSSFLLLR